MDICSKPGGRNSFKFRFIEQLQTRTTQLSFLVSSKIGVGMYDNLIFEIANIELPGCVAASRQRH